MARRYANLGPRQRLTRTPQTQPIAGREAEMIKGEGGGYVFKTDDWTAFKRFIILGAPDKGTYYVGQRKLAKEGLNVLNRLIKAGKGLDMLAYLEEVANTNIAITNEPSLFTLARLFAYDCNGTRGTIAAHSSGFILPEGKEKHVKDGLFFRALQDGETFIDAAGTTWVREGQRVTYTVPAHASEELSESDKLVRQSARLLFPRIVRTPTHRFQFNAFVEQFRGRGSALNRAVYSAFAVPAEKLAYHASKYKQREGWSQLDDMRLVHPKPITAAHVPVQRWIAKGWEGDLTDVPEERAMRTVWAHERAMAATTEKEVIDLILQYDITHEMLPTTFKKSPRVWEALLFKMPLEAMIRNLGRMTEYGTLRPMSDTTSIVTGRLRDQEYLARGRLHPFKVLVAMTTYAQGYGERGDGKWSPVREILDALNDAFYLCFANVTPTNKRIVFSIDVSGSMHGTWINGVPNMQAHTAAAALALVSAQTETQYIINAFDTRVYNLTISPRQRIDAVFDVLGRTGKGGTDCAAPITWAMQEKCVVDGFVLYTDHESWASRHGHAVEVLTEYRRKYNPQARFVGVQMSPDTRPTLCDPKDELSMDVIGFDAGAPEAISHFLRGAW